MRDGEETIHYQVTVTGDQWDHEQFRGIANEIAGAAINAESNTPLDTDRWAELTIQEDGIGISLYEQEDGAVRVVDETWFTNDEISEFRAQDGPGKVILDASE